MIPPNCSQETETSGPMRLLGSLKGVPLMLRQFAHARLPWRTGIVPHLPYELYVAIMSIYTNSVVGLFHVRQYRLGQDILTQSLALVSVMLASVSFGDLVCQEWNRYWPVLNQKRWLLARPIVFFEIPFTLAVDLSPLKRLRFVSLPFNEAFEYRDNAWHILPFMATLPPGLQEVEFLWCHALESEIISLVRTFCPRATAIRIVHCTMFNNPGCVWWSGHQLPMHHSHYMRGHELVEADNYARTVALTLPGLSHLEHLHLGIYLVPFDAMTTHRSEPGHVKYHPITDSVEWIDSVHAQNAAHFNAVWSATYPNLPPPDTTLPRLADQKIWATPCPRCVEEWSKKVEDAERLAASTLALEHSSLKTISFASFVAKKRTDPSEWEVCRSEVILPSSLLSSKNQENASEYPEGTQIRVRTKRPGAPCASGKYLTFQRSNMNWVYVG